ncbi:MAG: UDP-N-acetylmuramate dehydrogenase [Pseudomonadota bacterium]
MTAIPRSQQRLLDRLPKARGRYTENAPLAGITWFRVGGAAEVMFRPADAEDLAAFLANKPADVPVTAVGVGSNLLVRDGGVDGVVVRLGRAFAGIAPAGTAMRAGAGALDLNVALVARDAGVAGLEFLSGVPGTIGGALRMNAGAYGHEMKDVTLSAEALDGRGRRHVLAPAELAFGYRTCGVPEDWIFVAAELGGGPGTPLDIQRRIAAINAAREESQPLRTRTGGSTFANPTDPRAQGRKAWELIEEAGCRGLAVGGAEISEKHCNFIINTGSATAADIEGLGEEVRRRVFERSGVMLEWEIRVIGTAVPPAGRSRA